MDAEAINTWDVSFCVLGGDKCRVDLEHYIVERGAKVRAVDGSVPRRLWVVDILAARAVQLHGLLVRYIGLAHREERVRVAEDAGAFPEVCFLVLVELW